MPLVTIGTRVARLSIASATLLAESAAGSLEALLAPLLAIERRLLHLLELPSAIAGISGELQRIAAAIESVPALRDELASLPRTVDQLEARIGELLAAINDLMATVDSLAAVTHPLHSATERLEQIGDRLESGPARRPRRWLRGGGEPPQPAVSST